MLGLELVDVPRAALVCCVPIVPLGGVGGGGSNGGGGGGRADGEALEDGQVDAHAALP